MQEERYSPKSFQTAFPPASVPRPKGGTVPSTANITREQRDRIYELVCNHLGGVGDVSVALENGDFATAERLAIEFGEDFHLLDDIGWRPEEERHIFELTMPPHDLMELLRRLRDNAERLIQESPSERRSREEEETPSKRFRVGLDACMDCPRFRRHRDLPPICRSNRGQSRSIAVLVICTAPVA